MLLRQSMSTPETLSQELATFGEVRTIYNAQIPTGRHLLLETTLISKAKAHSIISNPTFLLYKDFNLLAEMVEFLA